MPSRAKRAALALCAVLCAETAKKKRQRRVWTRSWLTKRGQYGMSVLQRELEMDDTKGFRDLLRMSVENYNFLLEKVTPHIQKKDTQFRKAISPRDRLSVTLRFLATGETFKSLSFQYRMGSTTISGIVMETCRALISVLRKGYLKTPTSVCQWKAIARDFADKWQFPHCLGAIDGKHVVIQPPPKSGSMFHNYRGRFSIILMAVVDANLKFTYATAGTQGRVADAGVFAHSDLKEAMDTGMLDFPPPDTLPGTDVTMPYMLVGDDAYPLRPDLMKPYPFRNMNPEQRIYNYRLSRARRVVENAFGVLANRFRVFLKPIALVPEKVEKITYACLGLHNYLRQHRPDAYVPPGYVDFEDENHELVEGAWRQGGHLQSASLMGNARNPSVEAKTQRDMLADYFLSPAGSVSWQEDMV